jgi:hypothetical protein
MKANRDAVERHRNVSAADAAHDHAVVFVGVPSHATVPGTSSRL